MFKTKQITCHEFLVSVIYGSECKESVVVSIDRVNESESAPTGSPTVVLECEIGEEPKFLLGNRSFENVGFFVKKMFDLLPLSDVRSMVCLLCIRSDLSLLEIKGLLEELKGLEI
jgi:hypothetical protein